MSEHAADEPQMQSVKRWKDADYMLDREEGEEAIVHRVGSNQSERLPLKEWRTLPAGKGRE